jgi:hypothetical protein
MAGSERISHHRPCWRDPPGHLVPIDRFVQFATVHHCSTHHTLGIWKTKFGCKPSIVNTMVTTEEVASPCPFSVEIIADESDEGSTGSVHLAIPESTSMASKAIQEEEEGPELVRSESSEDSASTNSGDKEAMVPSEEKKESHGPSPSSALVVANNHDDVGMIDCLSDQFANMFCPSGEQQICISRNEIMSKEQTCDLPCAVFNRADPSTDVFSHLQFWWSPSQEEKLQAKGTPQNRSIRHKSKHVKSLMDNWHPTPAEPLMRSKSILEGHKTSFPTNSSAPDGFYDSDPEVGVNKHQRRESLQAKPVPQNYRGSKPAPVDTISEIRAASHDEEDHKPCPSAPKNATRRSFHFASRDASPTSIREFDLMHPANDDYIRQFVQVSYEFENLLS